MKRERSKYHIPTFDYNDYKYTYNHETKLVEKVVVGTLQEKYNSCNYASLDKLFDKFLDTGQFDLSNVFSNPSINHVPNKLDNINDFNEFINDYCINNQINIDNLSYDEIMEEIIKKGASINETQTHENEEVEEVVQ